MKVPLQADIKAAIDAARETSATVQIDRVARDLAASFLDHDDLIELMLKRIVIWECHKAGVPMMLGR